MDNSRNLKDFCLFLMENPDVKQTYLGLKSGVKGRASEDLARIRKNNLAWAEKIEKFVLEKEGDNDF